MKRLINAFPCRVTRGTGCWLPYGVSECQTVRPCLVSQGVQHLEGGWPKVGFSVTGYKVEYSVIDSLGRAEIGRTL
jgi:hypothetical protein